MPVRGIGIERDVGEHADLGHRILQRADRAAHQIVGVERLAPIVGCAAPAGVLGNSAMQGMPRSRASRARATMPVDRPARHARQAGDRLLRASPSVTNSGQIRSAGVSTVSACRRRLQARRGCGGGGAAGKDGHGRRLRDACRGASASGAEAGVESVTTPAMTRQIRSAALIVNAKSRKGQSCSSRPARAEAAALSGRLRMRWRIPATARARCSTRALAKEAATCHPRRRRRHGQRAGRLLVGNDVILGVLPLGTANSFARTLGIPLDIAGAVDVLARARRAGSIWA